MGTLAPRERRTRSGWELLAVRLALVVAGLMLAAGCGTRAPLGLSAASTVQPVPTIAPIFQDLPTATLRSLVTGTAQTTTQPDAATTPEPGAATPVATAAAASTPAPTPDRSDPTTGLEVVPVYQDGLSNSWTLTNSVRMDYLTRNTAVVYKGRYALEATALGDFASLYFTVRQDSGETFPRDKVVGLRFQLSGGDTAIESDNLSVTVVGSNSQPYWLANDSSVQVKGRVTEELPLFPETRLYYLGINKAIPAGEWADVILWLDDLEFDPDYAYVTGFYLKNDGITRFYVDEVTLLLAPTASEARL